MRRTSRKIMFSLMASLLAGSTLARCSENKAGNNSPSGSDTASESAAVYPMQTDTALTYWGALPNNLTGVKSAHAEVPFIRNGRNVLG